MKIGAISGDLVVKVGLGVLLLGGAGMLIYSVLFKASMLANSTANAINPANPDNIVAGGVNAIGGAVSTPGGAGTNADGSWTLGGWLFDVFNPDTAAAVKNLTTSNYVPTAQQNAMNYETNTGNQY